MAKKYKKLTVWEDEYRKAIRVTDEDGKVVKEYSSLSQWDNAKRFAFTNAEDAYVRGYNFQEPIRITSANVKIRQEKTPRISGRGVFPLDR